MIYCSSPGPVITSVKLLVVLLFCLTTPLAVHAESAVTGNVINAPGKTGESANIAAGSDNRAVQSSVALRNVKMNSTVSNSVQSTNAVNVATGKRNVASQGSLSSNNSSVNSTLSNTSLGHSTVNMAIGTDNKADQGSVRIENSRLRGPVVNTSTLRKSTNMAGGNCSSSSQAAIVMGGTQLRGVIANTVKGEDTVNAAVGYRNEASQGSIVVDGGQNGSGSTATTMHNRLPAEAGNTGQGERGTLAYTGRILTPEVKGQKAAPHAPGQVVFLVEDNKAGSASLERVAQKYRLTVGEKTILKSLNRIMVVSSTQKDAAEIAGALKNESGIYNAQPNYVFTTMGEEDPLSPMQNLASLLDLQKMHSTVSGKNITVAVVDTGVEVKHEDLRARIVGYHNFIPDSVYQGEIHGTAVAGIIGADKNACGIVGIAPKVSLLALRACRQVGKKSAMGECFSTSLARSLDAAISAKADVVNLSLGAYVNDTLLGMMIDNGHEQGIVFAAPVGNDPAADDIAFPASHDKVISIAGLDEQGNPLPNKRLAAMADAVAPATHLFVTTPGNSYNYLDGTSLASASIAGIIALSMEKKASRKPLCLPRFNSAVPWSQQVFACLGFSISK